MDQILNAVQWVVNNWGTILSYLTGAVTVFSVIAKLTPGNSANKVADFLLKLVHVLSVSPDAEHARVIAPPDPMAGGPAARE